MSVEVQVKNGCILLAIQ